VCLQEVVAQAVEVPGNPVCLPVVEAPAAEARALQVEVAEVPAAEVLA